MTLRAPLSGAPGLATLALIALLAPMGPALAAEPAPTPPTEPAEPAAPAEPADDAEELDLGTLLNEQVVTTASQSAQTTSAAPGLVTSVSGQDLRRHNIRTLAEALQYVGLGFYVTSTRGIFGQRVSVRGGHPTDGAQLLVLVDGHAVNEQNAGKVALNEGLGVPFDMVDSIEFVIGPGSVLYGSNAMVGVINIVTSRAKDSAPVAVSVETGAQAPVDSDGGLSSEDGARWGLRHRLNLRSAYPFTIAGEQGGYTAGFYVDLDDEGSWELTTSNATVGNGNPRRSDTVAAGYATLRVGDFALTLNGGQRVQDRPTWGVLSPPRHERSRFFRAEATYGVDLSESISLGFKAYGDYDAYEDQIHMFGASECSADIGCDLVAATDTAWFGVDATLTSDWRLDGTLVTLFGVAGRHVGSSSERTLDLAVPPPMNVSFPVNSYDLGRLNGAVFAQQIWTPVDWLSFNAGLRFDTDEISGGHLSPRAAVNITAAEGTTVKLVYAEGFRAPTAYELKEKLPDLQVRNEDLGAETVRGVDLVLQHAWSGGRLVIGAFGAWYEDLVSYRALTAPEFDAAQADGRISGSASLGNVVVRDNVALLTSLGATASLELRFSEQLTLGANLSFAENEKTNFDGELLMTPRILGNLRLAWDVCGSGHTIALSGSLQAWRNDDAARSVNGEYDHARPPLDSGSVRSVFSGPIAGGLHYTVTSEYRFGSTEKDYVLFDGIDGIAMPSPRLSVFGGLSWSL